MKESVHFSSLCYSQIKIVRMLRNAFKSANNNIYDVIYNLHFFVQYCLVVFYPSRPSDQIYWHNYFFYIYCTTLCLFLHISLGYAIVLLCICTNNTNVAQYQAIWWLAEQLLCVNTESEYCKTECRRAFCILGRIVCTARTVRFTAHCLRAMDQQAFTCPQAHVSVCESMSDPTGFGFVCVRVCSFPIRTEVHHSSRATAATTCLEWERYHT